MSEQTKGGERPTLAAISESRMARDLAKAIRAWRKAGKPHRR